MKFIFLGLFLICMEAYAGRVIFVRGKVFSKVDEKSDAIRLKKNDKVEYNSLISTGKKSFVKIKFPDKSAFVVGPKSEIILKKKNDDSPTILNLISGKLRGFVKKELVPKEGHEHKLYVKTRSAVLGIRGTEFVVTYNNKNHNTSNITMKGEVDLYKKSDKEIIESLRTTDVDEKSEEVNEYDETLDLRDQLTGYKTQKVTKGTYSSAQFNHDEALEPVRISPKQVRALKRTNFTTKVKRKRRRRRRKRKPSSLTDKKAFNPKTKDGNRHGGVVDLSTGLYVAPPESAKYNEKKGMYDMPKELGGVDPITGDYKPPKGILLDPVNGFTLDPHYYGDRNIAANFEKLTSLAGPIDEQLGEAVKIFKHITRTDFFSFADLKYTTRVLQNYYGEYQSVTENPAFYLQAQGYLGTQLYHSKKYLFYLKGHLKGEFFDSDKNQVQRNSRYEFMGGGEFHRKITVWGKKASLVFETMFRKEYMNREMTENYLPFTEDTTFGVKNIFSFNKDNHSTFYTKIRYFQGYEEENHGKIHDIGFHHRLIYDKYFDFLMGTDYSVRENHQTELFYRITRVHLKSVKKGFFYKTDLTFGGTHEWHDSDRDFPFNRSYFKRFELDLNRRLGNFWKLNANYMYEDQETENDEDERNFNRHVFGLGVTMYY